MNFKPELLEKVLAGTKTQTRRPRKGDQYFLNTKTDKRYLAASGDVVVKCIDDDKHRTVYRVGQSIAACPGRGKKQLGRIEIVQIRHQDIREISLTDAKAEGFENQIGFWEVWCGFYDKKFPFTKQKSGMFAETANKTVVDIYRELSHRPVELYWAWTLTFRLVK